MNTGAALDYGGGHGLLERQRELELILDQTRSAAAGSGGAMLLEGPAGIGKTALVRAARAAAQATGMTTLLARGAELERDFGFGVVRQLFEPVILDDGEVAGAFAGRARPAGALFDVALSGPAPESPVGPEASFTVLSGLYWLTVNLARSSPLALLVDDAHWADPGSLRFLSYLARRLAALPVLLIVSARPAGESGGEPVESLLHDVELTRLRPQPVSAEASARLVRASLADAGDEVCQACHAASGGNPFFLRELVTALVESDPVELAQVTETVPRSVVDAVRLRIARLPVSARELARGVAILGDGTPLRHAAHVVELGDRAAAEAADVLVAAAILAPERPLRFLHPLIRTAVYGELPHGVRGAAHERAAQLLAGEDASPERVAAHLTACEPRARSEVCRQLRAAAREGLRRGAPEAAVTYLRRALDEPPPPGERAELLLELGEAEALTLDQIPAAEHLSRGIEGVRDPERRLRASLLLAGVLGMDDRSLEGVEVLERALVENRDADSRTLARVNAHLVNVARFDLDTRTRTLDRAVRLRRDVDRAPGPGGVELTAAAAEEAMAGESAQRTAELAERALVQLAAEGTPIADYTMYTAGRCLIVADRLLAARRVFDRALAQAREQGALVSAAGALGFRADVNLRLGELQAARDDAWASVGMMRDGWRIGLPASLSVLVNVLIEWGETDSAERAILEGGLAGPAQALESAYPLTMLLHARGNLRLAQGQSEAALEDLLEVGRREEVMAEPNPALMDWRTRASSALAQLGRHDEALGLAEEEVRLARRFGAPRALANALRVNGVVAGGRAGLELLLEAEAVLAGSPARLVQAQVLVDLGFAFLQVRDGASAKSALSRAMDIAHACGAHELGRRALAGLRSTGARPRRAATTGPDALTRSERRVAELASQGLSNREIADQLFVTDRTIEFHLTGAFRKLNIQSRSELERALI